MLDIKFILENQELVKEKLSTRGTDVSKIDEVISAYGEKRNAQKAADDLRSIRKTASKEIGQLKSKGENADAKMKEVADLKEKLSLLEKKEHEANSRIEELLLGIPNLPADDAPVGKDESDNVEIKKWGEPRVIDFEPKNHYDIGTDLDVLDFERGAKIAGSGFILSKGGAAKLERALIQFMLDVHSQNGYSEMFVPFLINRESLIGTGQLPKFEEDQYRVENDSLYLNPTAEVPLTNIYRDEIIDESQFPIWMTAYAPSFRKEAGSYGKDTKGLIRVHQFNKVELVKIVLPEESEKEHEQMLQEAELILKKLNLPYRVVVLSTGDMGFSAAKCYDIEVWLPSQKSFREISSVSNCRDYQARRANIRVKRKKTGNNEYPHTLNGSGLAVGRTVVAIMENYQKEDGTVEVPEALIKYMGGMRVING